MINYKKVVGIAIAVVGFTDQVIRGTSMTSVSELLSGLIIYVWADIENHINELK